MVVLRKMRGNEEVEGRQGLRGIETEIDRGLYLDEPKKNEWKMGQVQRGYMRERERERG